MGTGRDGSVSDVDPGLNVRGWDALAPGIWRGGPEDAPQLAVVGGIHGDETAGVHLVQALLRDLDTATLRWNLHLAVGNPEAVNAGVRHLDSDLNRAFGAGAPAAGVEGGRAATLRSALGRPRLLLDVHQTHCDTPPLAVVKDTQAHLALACALGLDTAVVDAGRIYGDTMLADLADAGGGLGLTIESGRIGAPESLEAASSAVSRALLGEWRGGASIRVYAVRSVLRSPWDGLRFLRALGNGSPVRAGEVLAAQGD